jgi:hypothetical protein
MLKSPLIIQGTLGGGESLELIKEGKSVRRSGRSVDIGDKQGQIRGNRTKVNRDGIRSRGRVNTGETGVGPSSKNTTRRAISIRNDRRVKATRKKGIELAISDISKLSFLKQNNIRARREELNKNIATFHRITQTLHSNSRL